LALHLSIARPTPRPSTTRKHSLRRRISPIQVSEDPRTTLADLARLPFGNVLKASKVLST
jgi:hypothetical protein